MSNRTYTGGLYLDHRQNRWRFYGRDQTMYVQYARAVLEAKLGRHLAENEVTHHINGDTTDDRPENLEVMDRAEHQVLHWKMRKKDWKYAWSAEHASCVECGTTSTRHYGHGQCQRCYKREWANEDRKKARLKEGRARWERKKVA